MEIENIKYKSSDWMKPNPNFRRGVSGCFKYYEPKKSGIYILKNDKTGHFYIGNTSDISTRLSHHFSDLKKGKHICKRFQENYDEYGVSNFSFKVFEIYLIKERNKLEISILNSNHNNPFLLNTSTINNSWINTDRNKEMTDEWREKVSKKAKTKVGKLNHFYGKKHSDEAKSKISKANKGRKNESDSIPIVINGVKYYSMTFAGRELGMSIPTISHRIKSKNPLFSNWYVFEDNNSEVKIIDDRLLFEPNTKPSGLFYIEGNKYFNITDIMEDFNLKHSTILHRLNSENFPEWIRVF